MRVCVCERAYRFPCPLRTRPLITTIYAITSTRALVLFANFPKHDYPLPSPLRPTRHVNNARIRRGQGSLDRTSYTINISFFPFLLSIFIFIIIRKRKSCEHILLKGECGAPAMGLTHSIVLYYVCLYIGAAFAKLAIKVKNAFREFNRKLNYAPPAIIQNFFYNIYKY